MEAGSLGGIIVIWAMAHYPRDGASDHAFGRSQVSKGLIKSRCVSLRTRVLDCRLHRSVFARRHDRTMCTS